DDIMIYSNTAKEHVEHVKKVIDVLRREKVYLSEHKLKFFVKRMKVLGHVVDDKGNAMDPDKVDKIANWKTPTSGDALSAFLGAVGFLAPDCKDIRIPMQVLSKLTGKRPWRWGPTEHRAFEEVKTTVQRWREHHRTTLSYAPEAPPIMLVCDASLTGGSGIVCQGQDLSSARVVAFWSGKFNSAQQNYPVHEQELLAIIESLKRFKNLLQGAKFQILTDHKGLEFIKTQKNLSPRQARWLETLTEYDFEIKHIPGETNTLADALSRIYRADPPGTVRAPSEYVGVFDDAEASAAMASLNLVSYPVFIGTVEHASTELRSLDNPNDRETSKRATNEKDAKKLQHKARKVTLTVRNPETGKLEYPERTIINPTSANTGTSEHHKNEEV